MVKPKVLITKGDTWCVSFEVRVLPRCIVIKVIASKVAMKQSYSQ